MVQVTSVSMAGNPPSRPQDHQTWLLFKSDMIFKLSPGRFALRPKTCVTPQVSGVEQCSREDQLMFHQVDQMERNLLDTVIDAKIRELNSGANPKVLLSQSLAGPSQGYGQSKTLHLFTTDFGGAKTRKLARELGELLEMGYEQILIPAPMVNAYLANLGVNRDQNQNQVVVGASGGSKMEADKEVSMMDHNYCDLS